MLTREGMEDGTASCYELLLCRSCGIGYQECLGGGC